MHLPRTNYSSTSKYSFSGQKPF